MGNNVLRTLTLEPGNIDPVVGGTIFKRFDKDADGELILPNSPLPDPPSLLPLSALPSSMPHFFLLRFLITNECI